MFVNSTNIYSLIDCWCRLCLLPYLQSSTSNKCFFNIWHSSKGVWLLTTYNIVCWCYDQMALHTYTLDVQRLCVITNKLTPRILGVTHIVYINFKVSSHLKVDFLIYQSLVCCPCNLKIERHLPIAKYNLIHVKSCFFFILFCHVYLMVTFVCAQEIFQKKSGLWIHFPFLVCFFISLKSTHILYFSSPFLTIIGLATHVWYWTMLVSICLNYTHTNLL